MESSHHRVLWKYRPYICPSTTCICAGRGEVVPQSRAAGEEERMGSLPESISLQLLWGRQGPSMRPLALKEVKQLQECTKILGDKPNCSPMAWSLARLGRRALSIWKKTQQVPSPGSSSLHKSLTPAVTCELRSRWRNPGCACCSTFLVHSLWAGGWGPPSGLHHFCPPGWFALPSLFTSPANAGLTEHPRPSLKGK